MCLMNDSGMIAREGDSAHSLYLHYMEVSTQSEVQGKVDTDTPQPIWTPWTAMKDVTLAGMNRTPQSLRLRPSQCNDWIIPALSNYLDKIH
jgi:hypothetical protein